MERRRRHPPLSAAAPQKESRRTGRHGGVSCEGTIEKISFKFNDTSKADRFLDRGKMEMIHGFFLLYPAFLGNA